MAPHCATEHSASTIPGHNGQPKEHASSRHTPAQEASYLAALSCPPPGPRLTSFSVHSRFSAAKQHCCRARALCGPVPKHRSRCPAKKAGASGHGGWALLQKLPHLLPAGGGQLPLRPCRGPARVVACHAVAQQRGSYMPCSSPAAAAACGGCWQASVLPLPRQHSKSPQILSSRRRGLTPQPGYAQTSAWWVQ